MMRARISSRDLDRAILAAGFEWFDARVLSRAAWSQSGCLLWTGSKRAAGYGKVRLPVAATPPRTAAGHAPEVGVHRAALVLATGTPLGDGMQVDHLCKEPSCLNVAHLEQVTGRVNLARGEGHRHLGIASRLTSGRCPQGHEDWRRSRGGPNSWVCAECDRERNRRRSSAIKAARKTLGLSYSDYGRMYGWSLGAALAVLADSAPRQLELWSA